MSTESNKVYITEDFEHLKRAYLKWGEVKFPVFHKVGNAYQQYTDEKTGSKRDGSSDLRDIQSELAIIKDDMQQTRRGLSKKMDDLSKEIMIWKIISITLAIILMVTVTYPFIFPKQYSINDKEMPRIKSYIDSKDSTTRIKYDSIRIKKLVLVDSSTLKRASETTTDSLNSYLSDSITVLIVKSQFY